MENWKRLLAEWKIYNARVHADTKAAPITIRDVENAFYAGGLSSLLIVAREKAKDHNRSSAQLLKYLKRL